MTEKTLLPEIMGRKSLTNWTHHPIEQETWEVLFEAARSAPSSWNKQPARYVLVVDRVAKQGLCDALHRTNRWAANAAGLIVQVAAPEDDDYVDGKSYYLYDCGLSMMSLVYQAQSMGITTRQMIGFDELDVKSVLGIPARYRVVIVAGLGYPSASALSTVVAETKRKVMSQHKRIALRELISVNHWEEA